MRIFEKEFTRFPVFKTLNMSAVELTAFKFNGKSSKGEGQTVPNAMKEGILETERGEYSTSKLALKLI